jgi:hypothetical protein
MYGFGAKIDGEISNCFPLIIDELADGVEGME